MHIVRIVGPGRFKMPWRAGPRVDDTILTKRAGRSAAHRPPQFCPRSSVPGGWEECFGKPGDPRFPAIFLVRVVPSGTHSNLIMGAWYEPTDSLLRHCGLARAG